MSEQQYIEIPIPVHPDDKDLPLSFVQFKLESGIFQITLPIQGGKTIDNILAILEIWKPNLVRKEKPELEKPPIQVEVTP